MSSAIWRRRGAVVVALLVFAAPAVVAQQPPPKPGSIFDIPEDTDATQPPAPTKRPAQPEPLPQQSPRPIPPRPTVRPALPPRLPIPPKEERAQAERQVRSIYEKEYAGRSAAQKGSLGRRLLANVGTESRVATRYVLLCEARDAAALGGDSATAIEAVRLLSTEFRVAGRRMLLAALSTAAKAEVAPEMSRATAVALLDLASSFDLDVAAGAAASAEEAARRSRDVSLMSRVKSRSAEIGLLRRESGLAEEAFAKLAANPEDAEARLEIGKYLCFARGRWKEGSELLARTEDAALKQLALRELRTMDADDDVNRWQNLADAWWEASLVARDASLAADMRARACWWYSKVHPQLNGLNRAGVEKRIAEAIASRLKPGLIGRFYPSHHFNHGGVERIDRTIEFDWRAGPPEPSMPADWFTATWHGYIKAPIAGRYKIVSNQDDGSRVSIDGKFVIDRWGAQGGVHEGVVELTGEPQPILIDYNEDGGLARFGLGWIPPGVAKAKAIPAAALFHQPRGRGYVVRPRPAGTQTFGRHTYAAVNFHIPWPMARQWCEDVGGHLVMIESQEEQDFIARLAPASGGRPWIGLSDEQVDGTHVWINGTLPAYTAWNAGDPHGVPGGPWKEDFVVIWETGLWADVPWGHSVFLCEWDD